MSGTWYPRLRDEFEAEQGIIGGRVMAASDEELDWDSGFYGLFGDGDVDARPGSHEELTPIDYDELGWAD